MTQPSNTDAKAAQFVQRLEGGDFQDNDWRELTAWLEESPRHREAFEDAQAAWEATAIDDSAMEAILALAPDPKAPAFDEEKEYLLSRTREFFSSVADALSGSSFGIPRAAYAAFAIVAVIAATLIPVITQQTSNDQIQTLATAVGESNQFTLADATSVRLNTATRMRYDLTKTTRSVTIIEGEAFFDVAKDPAREFRISIGERVVAVVGTSFNVRYVEQRLDIDVVEGIVELRDLASVDPVRLTAGEGITVDQTGSLAFRSTSRATIGWLDGRIVFRDASLGEILRDVQRYFPEDLEAPSTQSGDRYTGVIFLEDLDAVLEQLRNITNEDIRPENEDPS